jgi:hypothetical protein
MRLQLNCNRIRNNSARIGAKTARRSPFFDDRHIWLFVVVIVVVVFFFFFGNGADLVDSILKRFILVGQVLIFRLEFGNFRE